MAVQSHRLKQGGLLDRGKTLSFRFDGKGYLGYQGDSLASALLANGVSIVGRSFKYHRPRGIMAAGAEEPNAVIQLGVGAKTVPNLLATQVELYDGLEAFSVRGWPSANIDLGSINDLLSPFIGAGFYYKTFMFPKNFWERYESLIRRAAGFGSAPVAPDPSHYAHHNAHCDLLIVGGGPAGLMSALVSGSSGARVIIVDECWEFGGSLLGQTHTIGDMDATRWIGATVAKLNDMPNVTCLKRTTAFGFYDHNFVAAVEKTAPQDQSQTIRERLWRIRAKRVILAQGAFERPLVFCNNDRPGVMLSGAVSTYINRYGVCPGTRAVVFTNNDSAYRTAVELKHAGADVAAIVDTRDSIREDLSAAAVEAGIPLHPRSVLTNVSGRRKVTGAVVSKWDGEKLKLGSVHNLDCDLVAVSGGFSPAVHLHSHAGGRNVWDDKSYCFVPGENPQGALSVGSGNGCWGLQACLEESISTCEEVLRDLGFGVQDVACPQTDGLAFMDLQPVWRVPTRELPEKSPKQFVDFQNDVSVNDIRLAVREGFHNVEHVKRYTALGFGTDQGKLGNINGMAILAQAIGKPIPEVGTTTFRPAYTPITFGAGAGENVGSLYDPIRKTAIHSWHETQTGQFEVVGQWHRPWFFPRSGEDLHQAVARECRAVRRSVGIMDASTLGKIDVFGPDAVTFLERMYTHDIADMKIGKCAYGILLGEDGMVMDDGVMARLDDQHFYLTTTTGGAASVYSWLEFWLQTEWPELEVYLTSVTDQYSTITVAGPDSRTVLQKAGCDIELSNDSFPFMSVRKAQLAGVTVDLFRVSFSGELAFEANVDSRYALFVWERLVKAGESFGITPYGTETMHVLRAEKGFPIIGQDTDGSVTPVDLGLNWLLSKNKDFVGKRSLTRSDSARKDRKQFVGLVPVDNSTVVAEGAQLVKDPHAPIPVLMEGHVTSSYASVTLGHPFALALVANGRSRFGEQLYAVDSKGKQTAVRVVKPVFYDPKSERQRG